MMDWILPLGLLLFGLITGVIGEKFIFKKLEKFAFKKEIPGSHIIFRALRRMPFIWFTLAGISAAIISAPLKPDVIILLQRITKIVFLSSVTLVLANLVSGFVRLYTHKTERATASLIANLAKACVLVLGGLLLLQTLGIEITPIVTTLGISGLAVGLALQDTLANLFSGFYLIISKQVRTGDYVKLDGGQEGYVTDITWRNTTIRELSNNVIIVPNSKLASAIFTNYHLPAKEITLTMNVGVSYDSDLEQVERITVEVAKEVMREIAPELIENQPYIRFHTFGDFSIDFTLYMRVSEYFDQRIGKHLFIKKLHKRYQQAGISIPFPVRTVYIQNSDKT